MKTIFEIFHRFFILGLVSFGGPMAHLGYFRNTFVEKLKWLDEASYAKLVALSQFLPGPSSSQVGFSIGLKKGGLLGGLTAFIAFTFPSFFILYLLAAFNISGSGNTLIMGIVEGLKLFAVVIVADAALGMFKSFCIDRVTKTILVVSTIILLLFSSVFIQIVVLIAAAALGSVFINKKPEDKKVETKKIKFLPFIIFLGLLLILPFIALSNETVKVFSAFYEAGSLVFGGGHVVLPLLEQSVGDMTTKESFLLGYSLAQAVPGPMFTIASYLGADIFSDSPFFGALIATLAIFLPGFLLILAFWESFETYTQKAKVLNAIAGVNAAVVGLLVAVLINTVFPSGVDSLLDLAFVAVGLFILRRFKISILYLIAIFMIIGIIF